MKNSQTKLMLGLGLAAVVALVASMLAFAQTTGCSTVAECEDYWMFSSDLEGWTALEGTIEWANEKSFGIPFVTAATEQYAAGVLKLNPDSYAQTNVYLQPGYYRVQMRAGGEINWFNLANQSLGISFRVGTVSMGHGNAWTLETVFKSYTSDYFYVAYPTTVNIRINAQTTAYIDHIYLLSMEGTSTPTPRPTINPTLRPPAYTETPFPATAVPANQQATPIPVGTAACYTEPATTFGSAPATPNAAQNWSNINPFNAYQIGSNYTSYGGTTLVRPAQNLNHTTGTNTSSDSMWIAYDTHGAGITQTSAFSSALVFNFDALDVSEFNFPFYVEMYAQADLVPITQNAYIQLWLFDDPSNTWHYLTQVEISARNWYPVQYTQATTPTGVTQATALAFVAYRSDVPTLGAAGVYVDDIHVYGHSTLQRRCSGEYPEITVSSSYGASGLVENDDEIKLINILASRPCPANITTPNNFWGQLISQMIFFMDVQYALNPEHVPINLATLMRALIGSPLGAAVVFVSGIIDLSWVFLFLSYGLAVWAGYNILLAWKGVKRSTIW